MKKLVSVVSDLAIFNRALEKVLMSEAEQFRQDNERLREGLQNLVDQTYETHYTPETYAAALLDGTEP